VAKVGILLRVYTIAANGAVGGQLRYSKIDFQLATREIENKYEHLSLSTLVS